MGKWGKFGGGEMVTQTRRNITVFAVAAGVLFVFLYLIVLYTNTMTPVEVGGLAPDIQTKELSGESFSLQSLRGKPVLLNFFTPWCQPCIEETPDLKAFAEKYRNDIHVVMIDRGDGVGLVERYVTQYRLPASVVVLLDENDKWSGPYGVTGQPETFFITAGGKVVSHLLGPLTESQMLTYAKAAGMNVKEWGRTP